VAQRASSSKHFLVHDRFIENVVYAIEGAVVSTGDCEHRGGTYATEAEEVAHIHEAKQVRGRCSQVELEVLQTNHRVQLVVAVAGRLGIKHHVAHRSILVTQEIVVDVDGAAVEVAIAILGVASLFMRIDSPVNVVQNGVFLLTNTYALRVEVEGHVFVALDAHERAVNFQ